MGAVPIDCDESFSLRFVEAKFPIFVGIGELDAGGSSDASGPARVREKTQLEVWSEEECCSPRERTPFSIQVYKLQQPYGRARACVHYRGGSVVVIFSFRCVTGDEGSCRSSTLVDARALW